MYDIIDHYKTHQWPWDETHFVRRAYCVSCKNPSPIPLNYPEHFVIVGKENVLKKLIGESIFAYYFCINCPYAVYDHYPKDECEVCIS
ncbi:hypothetical protein [Trichoplusia ni ascovirus 2c]|uniref:hypothetical protein n=1 Tax=Trichoplusia ni ascovirus 2c TaxID=328615 RepID=UPI0000E44201|nr:hypothetical protein TNAV2c_gp041 [Trichoplusia ni ascovirus 2c]ABF70558.1 hypothetical protein [Trichoplusia ni ascovirus 2c]